MSNENFSPQCKVMLCALLERAVRDASGVWCGNRSRYAIHKRQNEALEWLSEWSVEDDLETPYTFPWICDALKVNPDKVSIALLEFIKEEKENFSRGGRKKTPSMKQFMVRALSYIEENSEPEIEEWKIRKR